MHPTQAALPEGPAEDASTRKERRAVVERPCGLDPSQGHGHASRSVQRAHSFGAATQARPGPSGSGASAPS